MYQGSSTMITDCKLLDANVKSEHMDVVVKPGGNLKKNVSDIPENSQSIPMLFLIIDNSTDVDLD